MFIMTVKNSIWPFVYLFLAPQTQYSRIDAWYFLFLEVRSLNIHCHESYKDKINEVSGSYTQEMSALMKKILLT